MADKNLNINILAKDKSQQALNRVQGNLNKTKSAVFNLKNAFIALGVGATIKSFIDVGKSVESLQVRLKFLFGSAEEGNKAFEEMSKFASKVPFSLGEIQKGAGVLSVVSADAKELATIMELTGNVAAVTGLDFATTSEQIQRSLSAGISSADLFREKGVKSMLGFSAGATVSIEETREALFRTFGANGEFAGATTELAQTLEGTLSMIGDKFFNFQKEVAEEFFVGLKKEFGNLNTALAVNEKEILQLAESVGTALADAVTFGASALRFFKENTENVTLAFIALLALFAPITAGIALVIVAVDQFRKGMEKLTGVPLDLADVFKGTFTFIRDVVLNSLEELTQGFQAFINKTVEIVNHLPFTEIALPFEIAEDAIDDAELSLSNYILKTKEAREEIEQLTKFHAQLADQLQSQGFGVASISRGSTGEEEEKDFSKDIQRLINKAKSEEEQMLIAHQNELKLIEDFLQQEKDLTLSQKEELLDTKILLEEKYTEALNAEYEKRKKLEGKNIQKQIDLARDGKIKDVNLDKMGTEEKEKIAKAGMRSAIEGLASHNKEMFALNKAFRIKDAVMDTAAGITKALAMGPIGIPLAILLGALGVAQVATIASQSYTGRRTGGEVTAGRPYMVGEQGQEMFVPNQSGTIVPNDRLGGGQTINVNIHANDTQGFDELLVKRRATIVNVINDALNSQGKEALV